jgi:ABC-type multidrug transport system ATPase subunit
MISIDHLTKRYGTVVAVDGLSFEVGPGRVTGFLGPNGAGKTTTLRMLLGLSTPDSGTATINGVRYRDLTLTNPPANNSTGLTPAVAVAVLGGYTAVLIAIASQVVLRRDVA